MKSYVPKHSEHLENRSKPPTDAWRRAPGAGKRPAQREHARDLRSAVASLRSELELAEARRGGGWGGCSG